MFEKTPVLRKTNQYLMPTKLTTRPEVESGYNIYPSCDLGTGRIFNGYRSLTQWIIEQKNVVIEGYVGVFWDEIQESISSCLAEEGIIANWIRAEDFLKSASEIERLITPFLGDENAVWGTKCTLVLSDLYLTEKLTEQVPDKSATINILMGPGAMLANWNAAVLYVDLPKNELQFRMRAGAITNLGAVGRSENFKMYKRFYFVDWVLLNNHKKAILDQITAVADGQWSGTINWMYKTDLEQGLDKVSQSVVRVRPWFEPGAWGGQWIKNNIKNLNTDVVNYAWSFEMIVPENGLVFESDGYLLEVSFDTLMFHGQERILGKHAARFGDEFPIRFDFLDTYNGGNLSIQCHPRLKYIQENFGERITQDETYYMMDCKNDAVVYLGFRGDIDPVEFKTVLEESQEKGKKVEIENYVQALPAKKHDLFLIPNGTVHSAGEGSLVLEISATPYIFTFKMYDWVRLDLEGKPRPINIDHAFNNLDFNRKGEKVVEELISKQMVIEQGHNWQVIHLQTHADHFYDVHRLEFDEEILMRTNDCCHLLMLVEGEALRLKTEDGTVHEYAYAETFMIPAAAGAYRLTNLSSGRAKVIKAFLK